MFTAQEAKEQSEICYAGKILYILNDIENAIRAEATAGKHIAIMKMQTRK